MQKVKAKKHFGQHFLKDENLAKQIVDSLSLSDSYKDVLEIGPGMGVLTQFLLKRKDLQATLIEIDKESIDFLNNRFKGQTFHLVEGDFLQKDLSKLFQGEFAVIGNFPYNISSQILFSVLEYKHLIPEVVGMFQKEVGVRIASKPGNKDYGILSVLMQAFYDVELLFELNENDFSPPPKVKSAVLRFVRKKEQALKCDEKKFFAVVKMAFNQRRKTLRNALKSLIVNAENRHIPYLDLRAEVLSWQQFEELTNLLTPKK